MVRRPPRGAFLLWGIQNYAILAASVKIGRVLFSHCGLGTVI